MVNARLFINHSVIKFIARPHTKLKIPFDNVEEFNSIANSQIKITLQMELYDYCIVTARGDITGNSDIIRECQARQKLSITDANRN